MPLNDSDSGFFTTATNVGIGVGLIGGAVIGITIVAPIAVPVVAGAIGVAGVGLASTAISAGFVGTSALLGAAFLGLTTHFAEEICQSEVTSNQSSTKSRGSNSLKRFPGGDGGKYRRGVTEPVGRAGDEAGRGAWGGVGSEAGSGAWGGSWGGGRRGAAELASGNGDKDLPKVEASLTGAGAEGGAGLRAAVLAGRSVSEAGYESGGGAGDGLRAAASWGGSDARRGVAEPAIVPRSRDRAGPRAIEVDETLLNGAGGRGGIGARRGVAAPAGRDGGGAWGGDWGASSSVSWGGAGGVAGGGAGGGAGSWGGGSNFANNSPAVMELSGKSLNSEGRGFGGSRDEEARREDWGVAGSEAGGSGRAGLRAAALAGVVRSWDGGGGSIESISLGGGWGGAGRGAGAEAGLRAESGAERWVGGGPEATASLIGAGSEAGGGAGGFSEGRSLSEAGREAEAPAGGARGESDVRNVLETGLARDGTQLFDAINIQRNELERVGISDPDLTQELGRNAFAVARKLAEEKSRPTTNIDTSRITIEHRNEDRRARMGIDRRRVAQLAVKFEGIS